MNKIKVANIIEEGRLGGPQIRIAEVARLLERDKREKIKEEEKFIDTTVIFPFIDGKLFKERLDNYNVSYKQLPLHRLTKEKKHFVRYVFFFFYEILLIYRFLKKHHFDIVHVSGGSWQYKGVIAGRLAGCKVLWHLNDTQMPGFIRIFFKTFADKFAHGFIVAAEKVRKYYLDELKIGQNKPVFEIQAPADSSFFNPDAVEPDLKISSCKGINIVTVANINPVKGVECFLRMAEKLNKEYSDLNFWIIGQLYNSQKAYYAELVQLQHDLRLDNCFFYGAVKDVRHVLKSADIYVCSSVAEASPLSVWEAMSMEKAIVSTDVGDVSRFVQDGKSGYIAPVGNSDALADKVKLLIDNSDTRKSFGQLARKTVLEKLDVKTCVKGHCNAYYAITQCK